MAHFVYLNETRNVYFVFGLKINDFEKLCLLIWWCDVAKSLLGHSIISKSTTLSCYELDKNGQVKWNSYDNIVSYFDGYLYWTWDVVSPINIHILSMIWFSRYPTRIIIIAGFILLPQQSLASEGSIFSIFFSSTDEGCQ